MIGRELGFGGLLLVIVVYSCLFSSAFSQSGGGDAAVMQLLKKSITKMGTLDWSDPNPCNWAQVQCNSQNRVTRIQIGNQNLEGTLPPDLKNLSALLRFEVMTNKFTGPLPSFSGLGSVQVLLLHSNGFSSIPSDFFSGMTSLQAVDISRNPFSEWRIPDSLKDATTLQNFSANEANIVGTIPDFLSGKTFPALAYLHLATNGLEGGLPASFSDSPIQSLWLNNKKQNSKLNGTIEVLKNMTQLKEVWLHGNHFTGPVPDLSPLTGLSILNLRDNDLTGVVPPSLVGIKSLQVVNLTNNHLQGSPPKFDKAVQVDMNAGSNMFCVDEPGAPCDPRVDILLSIAGAMGYPQKLAEGWEGNDPCGKSWSGISCSVAKEIVVVNLPGMNLTGTISPNFSKLKSLQTLILANNKLTGTIPTELTALTNLQKLDVSNNDLYGDVPPFKQSNLIVITEGNPNLGKSSSDDDTNTPPAGSGPNQSPGGDNSGDGKKSASIGGIVGGTAGGVALLGLIGVSVCVYKRRTKHPARVQSPNTVVIHPRHSGDQDAVKITVASSSINGGGSETYSVGSSAPSDMHRVEAGNMVISIQVLRSVTNNFSEDNILGRGGFGTVYKGELHDGTKIAVKRMESGTMTEKGLLEFKSEIAVLTKVRHRHLVALLGYCLDGNERLLVYEYMPQGTLSRFLFHWKEEELKPLEWTRRLAIALDVARGVEYLHGLAHQSFIHRDLKPSNILLGDDMRAKVADFGLVRLAPEGKASFETRLAGTFGYLAPEYAVTGRVTTKVDVFAFGVILMEMITGRKALDESQPEESLHLVTWFRRMHINKDTFEKAIDPTFELDEETLGSISTVAELAGHCCAREPYQRPDMGHVVNVLSSLVELWKPTEPADAEDIYGIDLDMTLPQALKKWQDFEGNSNVDDSSSSSYLASGDNTQTSIPTRPPGFADSFTSSDGR